MIDQFFWGLNTAVLAGIGYYGYTKYLRQSIHAQMRTETQHKEALIHRAEQLQETCIRITQEAQEQTRVFEDLQKKVRAWNDAIETQKNVQDRLWQEQREQLQQKRKKQYEQYRMAVYEKVVVREVVSAATAELQSIFQKKDAINQYNARIFDRMKRG